MKSRIHQGFTALVIFLALLAFGPRLIERFTPDKADSKSLLIALSTVQAQLDSLKADIKQTAKG